MWKIYVEWSPFMHNLHTWMWGDSSEIMKKKKRYVIPPTRVTQMDSKKDKFQR